MDFISYSSFKCVRKFSFCISPLVKRYTVVEEDALLRNKNTENTLRIFDIMVPWFYSLPS